MTLTELERLAEEATDGPWNTGPETGAGEVWVYCWVSPCVLRKVRQVC